MDQKARFGVSREEQPNFFAMREFTLTMLFKEKIVLTAIEMAGLNCRVARRK